MVKRQPKKVFFRKNEEIRIREVRLTGDEHSGIMSTDEALKIARQKGLDLVEINPEPTPSICKILDYDKFIYEEKKKKKEFAKKQKESSKKAKEIRVGPNTGDHDLNFKAKQAIEFLDKGHKVYLNVLFKGRNIIHKERGEVVLLKFAELTSEHGIPENLPKLSGRKMEMYLKPIKK
jgi:translation initiation factor IF-3